MVKGPSPILASGDPKPAILATYHLGAGESTRQMEGSPELGRFPIASVTKTLTALLAARLACSGVVDWDERVGQAREGRRLSLRTLLNHTAGLPFELKPTHWFGESLTDAELIQGLSRPPQMPLPPHTWHYSNFGYAMAARLLERATGQSFELLLADELLGPLGMSETSMPDPVSEGAPVLGAAFPAGDLWSTPQDLMTLGCALDGGNPKVVTPEMLALMLESATPDGAGSYLCAGIRTHPVGPHRVLVSSGTILGWTTCLIVWPRRGYSLLLAEAGYSPDSLRDVALGKWKRSDTVANTWWWDGQEVVELRSGDDVELRLRETTWPFPLFSGRGAGNKLLGVGASGQALALRRLKDSVVGPSLLLTRDSTKSAFRPTAADG
jgi:CubicO group peptidase (beta-lactamase class C family)